MTRAGRPSSLPDRTSAVEALIDAVALSASFISGRDREDILADARFAIREPLTWYLEHVHWPSFLTAHGLPIELSLAIDEKSRPSFRVATDCADHRSWLAGNWSRYLNAGIEMTGAAAPTIWQLMTDHLDINPPTLRSPVYNGVGYAAGGGRRSSIYFFIGGLSRDAFERRFPSHAAAVDATFLPVGRSRPDRYHGVAYDFDETAEIYRTKLYAWLDLEKPLINLKDVFGPRHDMKCAQALMHHVRRAIRPSRDSRCTLLQSSLTGNPLRCRHKVFLNCEAWSLNSPKALLTVLQFLSSRTRIDLSSLQAVLSAFGACEVPLLPVWVAVGPGDSIPSITFYFAPILERAVAEESDVGASLERMLNRATRYVFGCRDRDGSWTDEGKQGPSEMLTPRVALALSRCPRVVRRSQATGRWLANRVGDAPAKGRHELTLRSLLALHRLGFTKHAAEEPRSEAEWPEITALELLLGVETGQWSASRVDEALNYLLRRENWSGGWSGRMDDLTVTTQVVEALAGVVDSPFAGRTLAAQMLGRAAYVYWERPIPSEPALIASWLKGRVLCGADPSYPSVVRAIAHLVRLQQPDGRWLATPFETSSGDRAYLDPSCVATTALVIEALDMLRDCLCGGALNRDETKARLLKRARR